MKTAVVAALVAALFVTGCGTKQSVPKPPAVDWSGVNRVVVAHPPSHVSQSFFDATATRLVKALAESPVVPGSTWSGCHEEFQLKLYTGPDLVATVEAGIGDRPIRVEGETAIRRPSAEAKQMLQSVKDQLAAPYMAQFITYCEAREAALAAKPDAPWRLVFLPEVPFEHDGATEKVPTWVAVAMDPTGSREKLFIDARNAHVYRSLHLATPELNLPAKDGKPPLTPVEQLAAVCNFVACDSYEIVDIEFRPAVPLPMAAPDETFPAWAVTFADTSAHRLGFTGLFEAYTGGLVTEEMPPK